MFNRDGLFGKKDERGRSDERARSDERGRNEPRSLNATPPAGPGGLGLRTPPPSPEATRPEAPRPDLRFQEPPRTPTRVEEPSVSRLIVGPDIKLKGVEITDCDTLVVEGRVEASMDSRVVQIAETGVFKGCVSIDIAEIRGQFEGELTARKQLVIHATGRVTGNIRYGKIRIEEGGEISGQVSTLAAAPAQQSAPQAVAARAQPAASSPAELEGSTPEPAPRPSPNKHANKASATAS
jgi:cytoskeletal protein CcmA (bactofilin family)